MDASRLPQLSITKRLIAGSVAATLLGAIACEATEERIPSDLGAVMHTPVPAAGEAAEHGSTLSCRPADLSVADTLALSLPLSHGPYLAVQAPDSTMYFVVFPAFGDTSPKAGMSLMPSDSFVGLRSLRLPVRELRAVPWVFGRDTAEVVFARPGSYRVLVAHDLETDAPVIDRCVVRYLGGYRVTPATQTGREAVGT